MDVVNQNSAARGLNPAVTHEFGISSGDIRREKAGYACYIDNNTVFIQKARVNKESLQFAHYVKERLFLAGFTQVDRFLVSRDGKPYCEHYGDIYTAVSGKPGKEPRFDEVYGVCRVSASAAKMHALTIAPGFFDDLSVVPPQHREHAAFLSEDGFDKQLRIMRSYKKTLQKQNRLSDFDVIFLKSFDGYERRMSYFMELLDSREVKETLRLGVFSHNMLKEETVSLCDDTAFITYFDEVSGSHFLFDLASIIKRHIKASGSRESYAIDDILRAYCAENPLDSREIKTLFAILLYPDKFSKTCVNYYSKKRTWTPGSFKTVLEDITSRSDDGYRFITDYFEGIV